MVLGRLAYASRKGLNSEGRPGWGSQFEKSMADARWAPSRRQVASVLNMMGRSSGVLQSVSGSGLGGQALGRTAEMTLRAFRWSRRGSTIYVMYLSPLR